LNYTRESVPRSQRAKGNELSASGQKFIVAARRDGGAIILDQEYVSRSGKRKPCEPKSPKL